MSHYTVTVRVTPERLGRHGGDVKNPVSEMLLPYEEQTQDDRFLEFVDEHDELQRRYAEESVEVVRMTDGRLLLPWDETFRRSDNKFGTPEAPAHLERIRQPFKERFFTFEEFAKDWAGYNSIDPKKCRYGYWHNPNKKWDWWLIGGRWTGMYPLKKGVEPRVGEPGCMTKNASPGRGDIVRVSDIDFDVVNQEMRERAHDFFYKYQKLLAGYKFGVFQGPREKAIDMGLVRVEKGPVASLKPGERARSWEGSVSKDDERRHWTDVMLEIDELTLFRDFLDHFNPLLTYAGLDDAGWVEPGPMGWFGFSHATPELRKGHCRTFHERFIAGAGSDDLLVLVDCHI